MRDILVVFIALLILIAILYYLKIYRDTFVNVEDALSAQSTNDQYSTLLRLESTANNMVSDQDKLSKNFKDYKVGLDAGLTDIDTRISQLQLNTNSQLDNIKKTHLMNSEVVSKFGSNLTELTDKVTKDSDWTHVVYGELLQTSRQQQNTLDSLKTRYSALNTSVANNNNNFDTRIQNISKDVNAGFSSIYSQVNANYDKTTADVTQLENSVSQINSAMAQANSSIGQVNNSINAIKADYLPNGVFQSSIADANNKINNIKNDYVSKTLLTNSVTPLQAKFNSYSTLQDVSASYYPLKSGQTLEGSIKTMENKVANIGSAPDYVTKSMLANYYDKTGVDNAIGGKLSAYVTTANAGTVYYPLKSGQTLEAALKGFDSKLTSANINATTVNTNKLCLGSICIVDEPTLQKVFGISASGSVAAAPARAAGTFTVSSYPQSYVVNDIIKFDYTGSAQTFKSLNAKRVLIKVWGAEGGKNSNVIGGKGGYAEGQYDIKSDIFVYIGGIGTDAQAGRTMASGGWNGGGQGGYDGTYGGGSGGGGGGGSDVRTSSDWNSRIIVAGGGGGGNVSNKGGDGGGANGGDSEIKWSDCSGQGKGGTQSSGGTSIGKYVTGTNGSIGVGGNGASNANTYGSGGGGGGYYGGGGGGADSQHSCGHGGGGGGGSGYIGGVQNGTMSNGGRSGNGYAEISILQVA